MKSYSVLVAGLLSISVLTVNPAQATNLHNAGFQNIQVIPAIQLESNGSNLLHKAGNRSFRGHSRRGFTRNFRGRGIHFGQTRHHGYRKFGGHRSHARNHRGFRSHRFSHFKHKKFRRF